MTSSSICSPSERREGRRGLPGALLAALLAVAGCRVPVVSPEGAESGRAVVVDPYPLGPWMELLDQDSRSAEYAQILRGMIPNNLEAEWQRVDNPDSSRAFLDRHGGQEAVTSQPGLRRAWERRLKIEEAYLDVVRREYARRNLGAPFDAGAQPERYAEDRFGEKSFAPAGETTVTPVPPARDAWDYWPRWRGPGGQGTSPEIGLPLRWHDPPGRAESGDESPGSGPRGIRWKTAIPGEGNSSPVIWDDGIYLTTAFGEGAKRALICVDRETGSIRWQRSAPRVPPETRVQRKNGFASSTPVIDGERVIAFLGSVGLVAWDLDGNELWQRRVGEFGGLHGTAASPVVHGDLVILFQDQGHFGPAGEGGHSVSVALDRRTGEPRWRIDRPPSLGWCTPVVLRVGDRDELIHASDHVVTSYDPATGAVLWTCRGTTEEPIPTAVTGHGLVYVTSGRNGSTLAIRPGGQGDVTDTRLVWSHNRGGPHVPSPILWKDLLFIVNDNGFATCLRAPTGELLWQRRLGGRYCASPVAADGRIYFTNEGGTVKVMRADAGGEVLAVNELNARTLASPAILGGVLYFRTATHLLAVVGDEAWPGLAGTAPSD